MDEITDATGSAIEILIPLSISINSRRTIKEKFLIFFIFQTGFGLINKDNAN